MPEVESMSELESEEYSVPKDVIIADTKSERNPNKAEQMAQAKEGLRSYLTILEGQRQAEMDARRKLMNYVMDVTEKPNPVDSSRLKGYVADMETRRKAFDAYIREGEDLLDKIDVAPEELIDFLNAKPF